MGQTNTKQLADDICDLLYLAEDDKVIDLITKNKLKVSALQNHSNKDKVVFVEACRTGRRKVVLHILGMSDAQKKKRKKLKKMIISMGLFEACDGNTDRGIVRLLLERDASTEVRDKDGNTALIMACKKGGLYPATPELLAHKREAVAMMIAKGARLETQNRDGKNALITAIENYNEQLAHTLLLRGADFVDIEKWLTTGEKGVKQKNWVVGSCRAKFVWDEGTRYGRNYVEKVKESFLKEFDKDGSGYLDKEELMEFIATHLKLQCSKGFAPMAGLEVLSEMTIPEVVDYMKKNYPVMLRRYTGRDGNNDGKYDWSELLPIIKTFFNDLWTKNRPAEEDSKYFKFEVNIDEELKDHILGPLVDIPEHLKQRTELGKQKVAPAPAQEAEDSKLPLPDGWKEVFSDKHNKSYYYNIHNTSEVTWSRPTDPAMKPDDA